MVTPEYEQWTYYTHSDSIHNRTLIQPANIIKVLDYTLGNKYKRDNSAFTPKSRQRRRLWILHALINPHQPLPTRLGKLYKLLQIPHRALIQVMHHHQVSARFQISFERLELFLGRLALRPQPILHIDTPAHYIRFFISQVLH